MHGQLLQSFALLWLCQMLMMYGVLVYCIFYKYKEMGLIVVQLDERRQNHMMLWLALVPQIMPLLLCRHE